MVAVCGAVCAGEIFHRVSKVGVGIAQSGGIAGVAEAACGRELDLHQADGAAAPDECRPIAAFPHDHAMHQDFRHAVGLRMSSNQRIVFDVLGMGALGKRQRCHGHKRCER